MLSVTFTCLLIVVARVVDVSLGTLRTINVVHGRRFLAFCLGFVEILIWIFVVSRVINEIRQPAYALAYAVGFALGNYIGVTIEARLAMGRQVLHIITRNGPELAQTLREANYRVTQFDGYGRDGPVQELFVLLERRGVPKILSTVQRLDPDCFYTVDDVRMASSGQVPATKSAQTHTAPVRK